MPSLKNGLALILFGDSEELAGSPLCPDVAESNGLIPTAFLLSASLVRQGAGRWF